MVAGRVTAIRLDAAGREAARSRLELGVGAAVLAVVALLLVVALGPRGSDGYVLRATFARVDGLNIGSDVRIAGVLVGHVTDETVDPKTFLATVSFTVRRDIRLNVDSSASIRSESLLGGKYLAITPGGDEHMLSPGGLITVTQGSISLETLLSKFIGSVEDLMTQVKAQNARLGGAPAAKGSGAPLGGLDQ